MDLHARIRAAQVNAGEMAVVADLHERGLCDPDICELCKAAFQKACEAQPIMTPTLEDKLAMMVWYLEEVRQHRRGADPRAFESYLDDSEVVMWLDKMNKANRIRNTRFTDKR